MLKGIPRLPQNGSVCFPKKWDFAVRRIRSIVRGIRRRIVWSFRKETSDFCGARTREVSVWTMVSCLLELPDDIWLSVLQEWVPQSHSVVQLDTAICSHAYRTRYLQWIQNLLLTWNNTHVPLVEWIRARKVFVDHIVVNLANWQQLFRPCSFQSTQHTATKVANNRKKRRNKEVFPILIDETNMEREKMLSHVQSVTLNLELPPSGFHSLYQYKKTYSFLSNHKPRDFFDADWISDMDIMLTYILNYCVFSKVKTLIIRSSIMTSMQLNWKLLQQTLSSRVFPVVKKIQICWTKQACLDMLMYGDYLFDDRVNNTAEENIWILPKTVEWLAFQRLDLTDSNELEFILFLNHNVSSALSHLQIDYSLPGFNPLGNSPDWFFLTTLPLPKLTTLSLTSFTSASTIFTVLFRETLTTINIAEDIGNIVHVIVQAINRAPVLMFPALESINLSQDEDESGRDISPMTNFRVFLTESKFPVLKNIKVRKEIGGYSLLFAPWDTSIEVPTNEKKRERLELDFESVSSFYPVIADNWIIRCGCFPLLRQLILRKCPISWSNLCSLWESIPSQLHLETLILDLWFIQNGRDQYPTVDCGVLPVNTSPLLSLKELTLAYVTPCPLFESTHHRKYALNDAQFMRNLSGFFPNLVTLHCSNIFTSISGSDIDRLVSHCPQLISLSVTRTRILSLPGTKYETLDTDDDIARPQGMVPMRRFKKFELNHIHLPSSPLYSNTPELLTNFRWFLRWIGKSYSVKVTYMLNDRADDKVVTSLQECLKDVVNQESSHIWLKEFQVKAINEYE